ncbi:putative periplasmic membrane protein [Alloactinosynnema sp. L-07]|uniref:YdeI/OmpD-associated family protein n=1 Tax=Alloactinosynnema sp. L-07 TaxID=1653480 RepID=UPI00065EF7FB|nr:YdeI/OmpD-associated family protein [Alloactinosynnema sp. L-07]CRK58687.1 putative periplasmic membrane protein [Alloactinosynnema sp. L-07]
MTEPTITCEDVAEWESWLEANHDSQASVWIKIAKKNSGIASITANEGIDGALCFGWIDGQRRSLDETHFLQRYSRRRPKGTWSQVNVAKVAALTAEGRMRPGGLAEVEAAKADGRWAAAYASQKAATVPDDLAEALTRDKSAAQAFEALDKTSRYAILLDLMKARTPATRATRLEKAIDALRGATRA